MSEVSSYLVRITKYSHFIKVTHFDQRVKDLLFRFVRRFMEVDYTRVSRHNENVPVTTVYAWANKPQDEFRFHGYAFADLMQLLRENMIYDKHIDLVIEPMYKPVKAAIGLKEGLTPREDQIPILDYVHRDIGTPSKFVGLATGSGKTVISMVAAHELQERVCIVVRPMFIEKWIEDSQVLTASEKQDIMVIQGSKQLLTFLQLLEAGHEAATRVKIVILSNKTWQNWLKTFMDFGEEIRDLGYPCMPDEFFKFIGAGFRLIDEVHLDFHLNFKTDLFTHVPLSLSLSATLVDLNPFREKMYRLAYPIDKRCDIPPPKRYTVAIGVMYNLYENRQFRTTERGQSTYSHTAYEKSIMKFKDFKANYYQMIKDVVDSSYIKNYKPGNRLGVYMATREMCTQVTDYLGRQYPHLDVKRFVEGDPYQENFKNPDIRVTTALSGGTAHDVADLTNVVMTNAIQSEATNIQLFGRLRELKDGRQTYFHFFTCQDIPKHIKYHEQKVKIFDYRAKAYKTTYYNHRI